MNLKTIAIFIFSIMNLAAASELTLHQQSLAQSAPLITLALMQNTTDAAVPAVQKLTAEKTYAPKSRGKAFFMSLLVPGWGQHYAGAKIKRNVFFGLEMGMWATYSGFTAYSSWREEDYKTYAATHAGVNLDGKNNTYFIDVGNFADIYEHNDYRLQQRNFNKYYQDVDFYYWKWESGASRDKFDQLRISADTADNRALFVLGAIVANHVISAIDAVWSVHKYEQAHLSQFDWGVQFGDAAGRPAVNVMLCTHF